MPLHSSRYGRPVGRGSPAIAAKEPTRTDAANPPPTSRRISRYEFADTVSDKQPLVAAREAHRLLLVSDGAAALVLAEVEDGPAHAKGFWLAVLFRERL